MDHGVGHGVEQLADVFFHPDVTGNQAEAAVALKTPDPVVLQLRRVGLVEVVDSDYFVTPY